MSALAWQKSSYCAQGEACVHVAAFENSVALTESSDPSGGILQAAPTAWAALVRTVKETHNRNL
ncbi:DUF397 domain-containing protein [Streptomyces sp. NPDC102451]|uniref:DUF397 domain-containing protein n=1 Tax=Streptomyces sp. NPDC102451 TaxID=3366177 RepID=UPI00382F06FD